ncbi:hypothetical protein ABB26_10155 [Stenotrophomonas humi]|uniref:Uncharacterized protein n=1 Tax=Stenotrophomonas humi TaxID=405444 RepID=A0A0R0C2D6_9GAMM|nr:hypothetical protein ABB26_10155 [Stenotrophomonas humi]
MFRYVGGWELHGCVEADLIGSISVLIVARHFARAAVRPHYYTGLSFESYNEAAGFIERQVESVTGVGDDGSLQF